MEKYKEDNLINLLFGNAFLRVPINEAAITTVGGAIIVVDSINDAHRFIELFEKLGIAQMCEELPITSGKFYNFEAAIHIFRQSDDKEALLKYLETRECYPVIVVIGIVPEFLEGYGYIFRFRNEKVDNLAWYRDFREWIVNHVPLVMEEIKRSKTSSYAEVNEVESPSLYAFALATSQVWKSFMLSESVPENEAREWQESLLLWTVKALRNRDRFTGIYQVAEAVKDMLYKYIDENECYVIAIDEFDEYVYSAIMNNRVILFDDEFYWIPNTLLEKICAPLLKVVTFEHVKRELMEEGVLSCGNGKKKSYTTKKLFTIGNDKTSVRPRLIKIKREAMVTDEGLSIEEYLRIKGGKEHA